MSQAIHWIKSNLLIVICLLVILVSMVTLVWPTAGVGAELREQIEERETAKRQAQGYVNRSVQIPAPNPGEPPRTVRMTVNAAAVAELKRIFADMNESYHSLEDEVVAFNRQGPSNTNPHVPMLEGLFPETSQGFKLLNARQAYKESFVKLYESLGAGELRPPGQPPSEAEVAERAAQVTAAFTGAVIGADPNDPQLKQQIANETLKLFINRAGSISVYCPPTRIVGNELQPGVFAIGEWAARDDRPTMAELWQGQMNYWIQQDLIAAVRVANFDPDTSSVLEAPVKRILSLDVVPGYIGLTPRQTAESRGAAETPSEPAPQDDLNQPIKRDFRIAHTGRRSNALYDVRHATMSVLVDARQLPALLNAFGQVNLMTPIVQRITAIDQAEHLSQGYVYGSGVDVVRVDLLIETLWLREWTAGHTTAEQAEQLGQQFNPGLMPDSVRYRLSLPTRDPNYTPTDADQTNQPGRMRGGDFEEQFGR